MGTYELHWKDSIAFYAGMQEFVPDRFGAEWVDRIIVEEMRHLIDLTYRLEEFEGR